MQVILDSPFAYMGGGKKGEFTDWTTVRTTQARRSRQADIERNNTIQYTIHNTQYNNTIHNTQFTIHNTQYTIHNTQYTIHKTKYTIHNTNIERNKFITSFFRPVVRKKNTHTQARVVVWFKFG